MRLDPSSTALILVDLQKGILAGETAPHTSAAVLATAMAVSHRFRSAKAQIVLVHVDFGPDMELAPSQVVDRPMPVPPKGLPPSFSELADGLQYDGDIVVLKRNWGAFTGTNLDQELRRRKIKTVVLGGIATNFGVESTARSAWELGYDVVIIEDACASGTAELHNFAVYAILPQIARIVAADHLSLR